MLQIPKFCHPCCLEIFLFLVKISLFMKHSFKVLSLAIISCILWSTAFVSIKLGLRDSGPLQLAGLRFILAGIMVFPFCRNWDSNLRNAWINRNKILKIAFFQTFGLYSLFHLGLTMVSASVSALIVGAGPLFIGVLASLINNEPLTKRKSIALSIGFSGIALIALGRFGGFMKAEASLAGIGILILSNILGSTGNILISKTKIPVDPLFQNALQLFTGGVALYLLSFAFETGHFVSRPIEFYYAWFWLSFIAAAGFSLWFIVLNIPGVKVSEISLWKFIIPVIGAVLAWLILPDEKPEWVVFSGMMLVASSLLVMYYRRR